MRNKSSIAHIIAASNSFFSGFCPVKHVDCFLGGSEIDQSIYVYAQVNHRGHFLTCCALYPVRIMSLKNFQGGDKGGKRDVLEQLILNPTADLIQKGLSC